MSKLLPAAACGLVFAVAGAAAVARRARVPASASTRRRRCSRCAWTRTRAGRTTRCIRGERRSSRTRGSAWCWTVSATHPPRASRTRAASRSTELGAALGRTTRHPGPARRARGVVVRRDRRTPSPTISRPRVRRRHRLPLRVQPDRRGARRRHHRRAHRIPLAGDLDAWWYPARHPDRDEYLYRRAPLHGCISPRRR